MEVFTPMYPHRLDPVLSSPTNAAVPRLLLRPAEGAEVLGFSRSTMFRLIAQGIIPSITLPGVRGRFVPVEALQTLIAERVAANDSARN